MENPLVEAARRGHQQCVIQLLKHGARVESRDARGQTALSVSVEFHRHDVFEELIDFMPTTVDSGTENIRLKEFIQKAGKDREDLVRKLVQKGKIQSAVDLSGVAMFAFKHGIEDLAWRTAKLMDYDSFVKYCSGALHYSAKHGWKDAIRWLLDSGIDIDNLMEFRSALYYASEMGLYDTVKLLLEQGADPNACSDIPLLLEDECPTLLPIQIAVLNGHEALVKLLLDCGAVANEPSVDSTVGKVLAKFPPLHQTASNVGHSRISKILLQYQIGKLLKQFRNRGHAAGQF